MTTGIPKLPVWATVGRAYRDTVSFAGDYLKISRTWLAIAAVAFLLYNWLTWSWSPYAACPGFNTVPRPLDTMSGTGSLLTPLLIGIPLGAASIMMMASIAVAWHRLILRGEQISSQNYLRVDNVVWGYFWLAALFWLLGTLPTLLSVLLLLIVPGSLIAGAIVALVVGIAAVLLITRLSVLLPAKALALPDVTAKDAWERTRSNFWRISFGSFLCVFPIGLSVGLILNPCSYGESLSPVIYTLNMLTNTVLVAPVALTFLSLSYRHFFETTESTTS